jgi:succinyl-diaminopimelate desuccinylase
MHRLTARTVELINIPSPSLAEADILAWVAAQLPADWRVVHEHGEWVVAQRGDAGPGLLLGGHVDTVPAQGNLPAQLRDGVIAGLGASDMKGGVAVMLELAERLSGTGGPQATGPEAAVLTPAVPVTLLFFAREELAVALSPISRLLAELPELRQAQLVVMLEPTDNVVEVGCLGNIVATARFEGVSAHSARPWLGRSAVDLALPALARIAARPPVEVHVSGHTFTEVVSVVGLEAGVADNVIPPLLEARINYRYAPGREPAAAEAELLELLADASETEILSNAPAGAVPDANPWVAALARESGQAPRPKLAWTTVAEFGAAGIDAVNFGPGAPAAAHKADEWIETAALERCFEVLRAVIEGGP